MHAYAKKQDNDIQRNLSTVSEPNELLQWSCNYRKLHNSTTTEQF